MTQFETLIAELAKGTGLALEVDARESCALETEGLVVTMQYRREHDDVAFFAPVTEPGAPLTSETMRAALELACNGEGTRGNFLGLFEDALLMSAFVPLQGLDADALGARVLSFADSALAVRDSLAASGASDAAWKTSAAPSESSPSEDFMTV